RLERELPRAAARVRARRAGDGGLRVREHLRAPRRAARQPVALGRPAGVPDARRRAQLRIHDPAVRERVPRLREQGAVPSRIRGLDPDERGPGGSRLDGERGGPEGVAGARELRARARDRAARGRAGRRVPRPARAGSRRARDAWLGRPRRRRRGAVLRRRDGLGRLPLAAAVARGGAAAMSVTQTVAARVEELCGDLSRVRAPRGTELNARSWLTEAPLRMLL